MKYYYGKYLKLSGYVPDTCLMAGRLDAEMTIQRLLLLG